MRVILVANCAACPHFANVPNGVICRKMDDKTIEGRDLGRLKNHCPIPDWCPLSKVSLTASLAMN